MLCTNLKTNSNEVVSGASIFFEQKEIVALQVDLKERGFCIAASCYDCFPSLILANKDNGSFEKITFLDYESYSVWSSEISRYTLRVCLVKWPQASN